MATEFPCSPRAAYVACAPSLESIQDHLGGAFGLGFKADPDSPTGKSFLLPDLVDGSSLEHFALSYLNEEWLSKLDEDTDQILQEKAAELDFQKAEARCADTNVRLNRWAFSPFAPEINRMRNWIDRILGPLNLDEVAAHFAFGPGATTRVSRRKACLAEKYTGNPHATPDCADLAAAYIKTMSASWHNATGSTDVPVEVVCGNRVTTVPKNRKKRRTIAIEPDMNMFFQKGFGAVIRRRLKNCGVDLNDQTRNQKLAQLGSMGGGLATIDLSMASDTVSKGLVELLLPTSWSTALGMCRSNIGVLPDGWESERILYRKFSSMGNGYTFELESLIFSAAVFAVCPNALRADLASVYGDDIILPRDYAHLLIGLLDYLGFSTNLKKSHFDERKEAFRESCGKHYLGGEDVTPFYVKRRPKSLLDLIKLHNQLWRYQDRCRWLGYETRLRLLDVCAWLRSHAPSGFTGQTICNGVGDGAFVGYFDEIVPTFSKGPKKEATWDSAYYMSSFVEISKPSRKDLPLGALPASLAMLERQDSGPRVPVYYGAGGRFDHRDSTDFLSVGYVTRRLDIKRLRIRASDVHRLSGSFF